MKKLLLINNIACICFLVASCRNSEQPKTEITNNKKLIIKDSIIASDTAKVSNQTFVSGTGGIDQGTGKDTTKEPLGTKAIIHKAPEQGKIDSIKNAKLKNKK